MGVDIKMTAQQRKLRRLIESVAAKTRCVQERLQLLANDGQ